jgi:hypothetical protein
VRRKSFSSIGLIACSVVRRHTPDIVTWRSSRGQMTKADEIEVRYSRALRLDAGLVPDSSMTNAEWLARQLTEACGWDEPPRYLIRDRDGAFIRRIRAIGIRDRPVSARSPWQNGYAERLIGSIRWESLDHVVVVGERHLRHVLASYQTYNNEVRTHLSLHKDAPVRRDVCRTGRVR